jgi:hypothetical protein
MYTCTPKNHIDHISELEQEDVIKIQNFVREEYVLHLIDESMTDKFGNKLSSIQSFNRNWDDVVEKKVKSPPLSPVLMDRKLNANNNSSGASVNGEMPTHDKSAERNENTSSSSSKQHLQHSDRGFIKQSKGGELHEENEVEADNDDDDEHISHRTMHDAKLDYFNSEEGGRGEGGGGKIGEVAPSLLDIREEEDEEDEYEYYDYYDGIDIYDDSYDDDGYYDDELHDDNDVEVIEEEEEEEEELVGQNELVHDDDEDVGKEKKRRRMKDVNKLSKWQRRLTERYNEMSTMLNDEMKEFETFFDYEKMKSIEEKAEKVNK